MFTFHNLKSFLTFAETYQTGMFIFFFTVWRSTRNAPSGVSTSEFYLDPGLPIVYPYSVFPGHYQDRVILS